MTDSAVLQVVVGLVMVFAVFSVAVSRLNEAVLALLNYRARQLESRLRELAGSGEVRDLATELFDGPLRSMRAGRKIVPSVAEHPAATGWLGEVRRSHRLRLPSYVESTAFARGVLELVDPPARALLRQVSPESLPQTVTGDQRDGYTNAYRAAYDALTPATAAALHDAMPAGFDSGRSVTTAILGLVTADSAPMRPLSSTIMALPDSPLRTALMGITARAGADRDAVVRELASWYDGAMNRLSGWYKRRVGRFLLGYALLVTVAFNLDAVSLTRTLWQDSTVRAVTVAQAEVQANADQQPADVGEGLIASIRDTGALQLPFGWTQSDAIGSSADPRALPDSTGDWVLKALGWALAIAALSAGAPFWFDLLGRFVNMRAIGPKPTDT